MIVFYTVYDGTKYLPQFCYFDEITSYDLSWWMIPGTFDDNGNLL